MDAQQRNTPGSWRAEAFNGCQPALQKLCGKSAVAFVARTACAGARGPERAAVAVFAAGIFQPLSSVAHEVATASAVVIQGRREEGEIAGGQRAEFLRRRLSSRFIEQVAKDEGVRVVIRAVAFVEVRHIEYRVLEDTGAIAHAHKYDPGAAAADRRVGCRASILPMPHAAWFFDRRGHVAIF